MNTPCKKCIVRAACKEGCERLVDYLIANLDTGKCSTSIPITSYSFLANGLRQGSMKLYENDTKIDWNEEHWLGMRELEWRKNKWMYSDE